MTELPPEIVQLTNLTTLDLRGNKLTELPPELCRLKNLTTLDFDGNPLTSPPPEIVNQSTRAVLNYLRGILLAAKRQWISKMLVVGQGGVGKTSLLRALRGEAFHEGEETTHGIELGTLILKHPTETGVTMQLNTWDFAGQEIQHATHQFFLTNRSLFVLAWNARHGFEQGRLYYWLDTIKALAPDSPVLLVATWTDQRDADLPWANLRRKYPQIIDHYVVSNKTGVGVEELRKAIQKVAANLPLMGELWPAAWLSAAEAVRQLSAQHLPTPAFHKCLKEQGVEGDEAAILSQWLHDLGEILHFRENEELNDIVILKPQWVTRYIAKVLESEDVIKADGIFTRHTMEQIWSDLDPTMQERFLRLMEQFDLSYRTLENRDLSLVVERLPQDEAKYRERWNAIKIGDTCHEISMKFELSTIPAGIPTWYIARQHRFTTHVHWRTGVLLQSDEVGTHLALTRAFPHERYIRLTVRGPHPQDFFALLKDGIELTLKRFPGLKITRKVPCRCQPGCKEEYSYQDLLNRINIKPTIECRKTLKDVSVAAMLYGLEWSTPEKMLAVLEKIDYKIDSQSALIQREFLKCYLRDQSLLDTACPNVFTLQQKEPPRWQKLLALGGKKMELQLLCQYPGCWHPAEESGKYEIDNPAEWLRSIAPYLKWLVRGLKFAAPLASPALKAYLAEEEIKAFELNLKLTEQLVKDYLPEIKGDPADIEDARLLEQFGSGSRAEGEDLRVLRHLLDQKDPTHRWGGLKRVLTPEGHYFWLCEHHAEEFKK